jgi:hypothetical protein
VLSALECSTPEGVFETGYSAACNAKEVNAKQMTVNDIFFMDSLISILNSFESSFGLALNDQGFLLEQGHWYSR